MFGVVINFLIQNWEKILTVFLTVILFIIALRKKKPSVNQLDKIISDVLVKLPTWIKEAEVFTGAEVKKQFVLRCIITYVSKEFSLNLSPELISYFGERIEDTLSTPQKHNEEVSK